MRIREVRHSDLDRIKELYKRSGFKYDLPDFDDGTFIANIAYVDESDRIVTLIVARGKMAELYMIADPDWETPGWRFAALQKLHEAMRQKLVSLGIRFVTSWLPPPMALPFGRRLMRSFGWRKQLWQSFSRETEARRD